MTAAKISLDVNEATTTAERWRQFGDDVERRGVVEPAMAGELRRRLGDLYADYVASEERRLRAREAAYRRLGDEARRMAGLQESTRDGFIAEDAAGAAALTGTAREVPMSSNPAEMFPTDGQSDWSIDCVLSASGGWDCSFLIGGGTYVENFHVPGD